MRYGYFDNKKREYVVDRCDAPVSLTNYLGLENMCTVISHNAGGYSFSGSPEHGRITRFRPNAVPLDRPGHYVYLRDDDTGKYWSVSWQPVGVDLEKAKYTCRHGLSYSKFECRYNGISAEKTVFIPLGHDVELWDVKITNTSKRKRKITRRAFICRNCEDGLKRKPDAPRKTIIPVWGTFYKIGPRRPKSRRYVYLIVIYAG